mgnify:CR=1 FL=1
MVKSKEMMVLHDNSKRNLQQLRTGNTLRLQINIQFHVEFLHLGVL